MNTKFRWRNVVLAATLPAVLEVIWQIYNTYVPVFLQAGNPNFADASPGTLGFGLGPALTGIILVLDNIAGLFISPLVGAWSDSLRTRWGRRLPFLFIGIPIAIAAVVVIPLIPMAIDPALSGKTSELGGLLVPFIISLFVVLIAFAIVRPIADVLIFDITPSAQRTTANGIAGAIAGFLVVAIALGGAALYGIYGPLPFWLAAGFAGIILLLVKIWIKEPESLTSARELEGEIFNLKGIFLFFKRLPRDNAKSLVFLLLSNLMAYVALAQLQAFLTSYGVFALKMEMASAAMLVAIPAITYMVVAIPAGMLARKTGRKMTQYIGLIGFTVGTIVIWLVPSTAGLMIGLAICGILWPIANVNHVIMVVDSAPVETLMGSYTGIRQISVTLGFIVGPVLGGSLVEAFGNNYRAVWPIMVVFLVLATLFMIPVTTGEAKKELAA